MNHYNMVIYYNIVMYTYYNNIPLFVVFKLSKNEIKECLTSNKKIRNVIIMVTAS